MKWLRFACLLTASAPVVGCAGSDGGPPGGQGALGSEVAEGGLSGSSPDVAVPTSGATGDAGSGLRVELGGVPALPLCPGQCATLNADVQGAGSPPTYAWTHAETLAASTEPSFQVCPVQTAEVAVEVTASTMAGEFVVDETATATATLHVGGDACVTTNWEPNRCQLEMPMALHHEAYVYASGDVDAHGNLYLALHAAGAITVAPGVVREPDPGDAQARHLELAKFDSKCELQWVKRIDGVDAPVMYLGGLDVDPEGNIVLLHERGRPADAPEDNLLLQTFSPDGEPGWALPHTGTHGQAKEAVVAWGDDGSVALVGLMELCAEQHGFEALGQWDGTCVGRVDAQGEPVFAHFLPGAPIVDVDLDPQGNLVAAGLFDAWRVGEWMPTDLAYDPHACPVRETCRFAVQFGPLGELRWAHVDLMPDWGHALRDFTYTVVRASRAGDVVVAYRTSFGTLQDSTPGALVWRFDHGGETTDRRQLMAHPSPVEAIVSLSAFSDGVLVTSAFGDFGEGEEIRLRTWDREGQLLGESQAEGHTSAYAHAARATQGDQVVVTHLHGVLSTVDLSGYDYTFYASVLDRPSEGGTPQP